MSLQVWPYLELSVQNIFISEPGPICQERCLYPDYSEKSQLAGLTQAVIILCLYTSFL